MGLRRRAHPALVLVASGRVSGFRDGLRRPKSVLAAVYEWASGGGDDDAPHGWQLAPDHLTPAGGQAIFKLWRAHERGTLPRAGGWEEQPLAVMVQIEMMDLVTNTVRYMARKDADWNNLTRLQRDLVSWLEGDSEGEANG